MVILWLDVLQIRFSPVYMHVLYRHRCFCCCPYSWCDDVLCSDRRTWCNGTGVFVVVRLLRKRQESYDSIDVRVCLCILVLSICAVFFVSVCYWLWWFLPWLCAVSGFVYGIFVIVFFSLVYVVFSLFCINSGVFIVFSCIHFA